MGKPNGPLWTKLSAHNQDRDDEITTFPFRHFALEIDGRIFGAQIEAVLPAA